MKVLQFFKYIFLVIGFISGVAFGSPKLDSSSGFPTLNNQKTFTVGFSYRGKIFSSRALDMPNLTSEELFHFWKRKLKVDYSPKFTKQMESSPIFKVCAGPDGTLKKKSAERFFKKKIKLGKIPLKNRSCKKITSHFHSILSLKLPECTKIKDLRLFPQLDGLRFLDLSNNLIEDPLPLLKLPKLAKVNLSGNKIKDLNNIAEIFKKRGVEVLFNSSIREKNGK